MRKILSCCLALMLTAALAVPAASAAYTDILANSALASEVQKAVNYGLMNGYSADRFGYSDTMTRAQFITVLYRMMSSRWMLHVDDPTGQTFPDVPPDNSYYIPIEAAAQMGVVDHDQPFRPNAPVTRGEMAEMLVRALGLKSAADMVQRLWENRATAYSVALPFADVSGDSAKYIFVAYDIGMTNGTSATTFSPDATATRAQAAAMLVRIYEKLHQETDFCHGFYAISAYSQLTLAEEMDAVSAGWSRMTWDGKTALLSTTSANRNEYYIPSGYDQVTTALEAYDVPLNLSVYMDAVGGAAELLSSEEGQWQAIEQIINELTVSYKTIGKTPYSGVTIDFEGLRSSSRDDFTRFVERLGAELRELADRPRSLYVCVSPILSGNEAESYSGYDYGAIGAVADKVILMAYDYDARDMSQFLGTEYYRTAATAPIDQVYLGLRTITEQMDPAKVVLGFSARSAAWEIDGEGKLLSGTPVYPSNDTVARRLAQADTEFGWSDTYQQSYAVYTTESGQRYFLWYQNSDSLRAALDAARLQGVTGVSIWRLGNIPQYAGYDWSGLLV